MKIAFICTEKLPSPAVKGGAIQMMIDGIVPYLKENHEITIFSVTDPSLSDYEQTCGVTYRRFPRNGYRFFVADELKKREFDIIHVCNRPRHIPLYKEASPVSHFILSVHNEMFAQNKISDEEGKMAIEKVTAITTVSQFIKDTIVARFPEAEEKTSVVYSGVDLSEFQPVWSKPGQKIRNEMRKKYGIPKNSKVILFIGRLSPSKGPHILIQAMNHILLKHEDTVLVIVGGKWFSDNRVNKYVRYLHTLAAPYDNHIIFTNYVPASDIYHMYVMGDLFVCSSQWNEPLARVHYEAMAAGIPILTTDRGGNAEVIQDEENGLLIKDYKNPYEYARIINAMLEFPGFGSWLSQNGRRVVEEKFDFKHVADRFEAVYLQAADSLANTNH
ncbi:glycosyltransferase involved in cell wall bisynthesis [Bacillus oleivorans]|uniref:Glycosyltransferase involved in cell wall bisynthesis n=1 Tax=Bacillus oleivorans TaxID=1448271 RepID=A0A285CIL8_9BACI|nr:glycosyltransferase family 4 protein [Bacillus oleivorans]SNX66846.1 glycosyltransferase involved in cell wall bisynthesis [Bacillus oleivorans]